MRCLVVLVLMASPLLCLGKVQMGHPDGNGVVNFPNMPSTPTGVTGIVAAGRAATEVGVKLVNVAKALKALSGLDLTMGVSFAVANTAVKRQFDGVNNSISLFVKGRVLKMTDVELASTYGQFMQTDIQQLAAAARNNKTMAIGSLAKVAIEKAKIILAETKDPSELNPDFMVVVSWLFFIGKTISEQGGGNYLAQSVVRDIELSPDTYTRKPTSVVQ